MWNSVLRTDANPTLASTEIQPATAWETRVEVQRLPAVHRQAATEEQENSTHSHLSLPEGQEHRADVRNCFLLAAHLHFLATNHWWGGSKFQGNKHQRKIFQLESWSFLTWSIILAQNGFPSALLSYANVWDKNLDTLEVLQVSFSLEVLLLLQRPNTNTLTLLQTLSFTF